MATAFLGYKHSPKSLNIDTLVGVVEYLLLIIPISINKKNRYYSNNADNNLYLNDKYLGTSLILSKNQIQYEKIYTNLHIKENRDKMNKELKDKQGIYMVLNLVTENYYIGSASTNKFISRFSRHLIYLSGSKLIKNSVLKYSLPNFAFIILEFYPEIINRNNNKELLKLETKYIKILLPEYNILTEAGNSFGYKHNEEIRKKMSENFSLERREFIKNLNLNKRFTIETRQKLSESAFKRLPMSYETKLKCITKERPLYLYDDKDNFLLFCPNLRLASLLLHCSYKTLQRALKNNKIYSDPLLINFINENKLLSIDELLLNMGIYPYIKDSNNKDLISKLYNLDKNKKIFYHSTNKIKNNFILIILKNN